MRQISSATLLCLSLACLTACSPDEGGIAGATDAAPTDERDGAVSPTPDSQVTPTPDVGANPDQGRPDAAPDGAPIPDGALDPDVGLELDGALDPDGQPNDAFVDSDGDAPAAPPPDGDCGGPEETALIARINAARGEVPVAFLACDSLVGNAARAQAQYMCDSGEFTFDGPNGEDAIDRVRAAGSNARRYGAAISRGRDDPNAVFDSWAQNEGISNTMVADDVTRIGVGYVPCDNSRFWVMYVVD